MVRLKKIATGTTGSEIAEAALVIPIFFLIMLGIYWFGRAFNTYATINHAAREGARAGRCADLRHLWQPQPSLTTIQSPPKSKQSLQASSLDPSQVTKSSGNRLPHRVRRSGPRAAKHPARVNLRFASTTTCNSLLLCLLAPARPLAGFRFSSNIPINSPFRTLL